MNAALIEDEIENIYSLFKSAGIELNRNKVRDKLNYLLGYRVPLNEAVRTLIISLRKEYNLPFHSFKQDYAIIPIALVKEDNRWVTVRGKVLQLWDPRSAIISQTGLIGDDSGVIWFTIFAKSADKLDITLEEGESYEFRNMVSSIWQNQISLKANSNSEIVPLETEIEVKRKSTTVTGILTGISAGSGLIKRCPVCKRKLSKSSCAEHGRVEGIFDLRLKAVLLDSAPGNPPQSHDLVINADLVEKLTGISLQKAIELAAEAMDTGVVVDYLAEKVLFRYYRVTGALLSGNFLVEEIVPVNGLAKPIAGEVRKLIPAATGGV